MSLIIGILVFSIDRELKRIAASYNIPVKQLYNLDLSSTIKRDDSALKAYLASRNALKNSYDMQQAQSLKEGLEFAAMGGMGNIATKATGSIPKIADIAQKYPLLTEKMSTGILAGTTTTVYDVSTKGGFDIKNTAWSTATGFAAGRNGLAKITAINSGSAALQVYAGGANPFYAAGASGIATIGGYSFGKGVQSGVHKVVAGTANPNMKYYDKKYLDRNFLKQFDEEYSKIPRYFVSGRMGL